MTVFDVSVNDRKVRRAGVGRDGVLNAIVTWVRLTGDAARAARRLKKPTEETRLHVGGLSDDIHRRWPERMLKVGDRVSVVVGSSQTFDPPLREEPRDPKQEEEQQRRYYLHLKRKFEGHSPVGARGAQQEESDTRFLNVDLDIWSLSPLTGLVEAFGKRVSVLYAGRERRQHSAHLELAAFPRSADQLIRGFVGLVERLPRSARTSWNRARLREFNIGVQAGIRPHSFELRLQPSTLQAAARVNARVGFTVYGAEDS